MRAPPLLTRKQRAAAAAAAAAGVGGAARSWRERRCAGGELGPQSCASGGGAGGVFYLGKREIWSQAGPLAVRTTVGPLLRTDSSVGPAQSQADSLVSGRWALREKEGVGG